jgi:hypothetical protein
MPLTMDIAEFNSGPQINSNFRDLIYAYHRSLLNLASSLVILENSLLIGIRYFNSQVNRFIKNYLNLFLRVVFTEILAPIIIK